VDNGRAPMNTMPITVDGIDGIDGVDRVFTETGENS
jgi:hypothetical protein